MGAIAWAVWIGENLAFILSIFASIREGNAFPLILIGAGLAVIRLSGIGFGLKAGRERGRDPVTSTVLTLLLGMLYWGRPRLGGPGRPNGKTPCAGPPPSV